MSQSTSLPSHIIHHTSTRCPAHCGIRHPPGAADKAAPGSTPAALHPAIRLKLHNLCCAFVTPARSPRLHASASGLSRRFCRTWLTASRIAASSLTLSTRSARQRRYEEPRWPWMPNSGLARRRAMCQTFSARRHTPCACSATSTRAIGDTPCTPLHQRERACSASSTDSQCPQCSRLPVRHARTAPVAIDPARSSAAARRWISCCSGSTRTACGTCT